MKKRMKTNGVFLALSAVCLLVVGCSTSNSYEDSDSHYNAMYVTDGQAAEPYGNQMPSASGDQFEEFADNPFIEASKEPASTFSVDADGDFNVGVTDTDALVEMVESYARKGIYMTCLGFGIGNLNDAMMEKISNSGNGTYHYIDSENEMMKVFVHERSQFVSVANDVKCQVTFDPKYVSQYRLIGYENRVMSNEDFENDKKDAAEIGAGQTITALYELVPTSDIWNKNMADEPIATFDCRYKKSLMDNSIPLKTEVIRNGIWGKPSAEFDFAAGIAAYGMILRDSPHKGAATIDMAKELIGQGLNFDAYGYRAELLELMDMVKEKD